MSIKKINKNVFEEITVDSVRDFVNKYLLQLMYLVAIILLFSLIIIFVINNKENHKQKDITNFYQATTYIAEGKNDEALELLQNIYSSSSNNEIKTISGIKLATLQAKNKNYNEAVKIYLEIYNLKNIDEFLKNLSGLSALNILISQNNQDTYTQIEDLITKMSNPSNPLLYLVQEQNAWFELQKGNNEQGLEILYNLLKQDIDSNTKDRVNSVIKAYEDENL